MSSEASLWKTTRQNLSPFGKLQRIELRGGMDPGVSDVCYCLRRKPHMEARTGWLELKECEWPKRTATPFRIPSLTLDQVEFLEGWAAAGGRAFLLAQVGRDYLLWNSKCVRPIFQGQCTRLGAERLASVAWQKPSPWPLAQLLDHLAGYTIP